MNARSTIFALSSGLGRAGVAVIRLSGPRSGAVVERIAGRLPLPRSFQLMRLMSGAGDELDRGIVIWLPGPGTVTGEDMAEFHVHGSPAVIAAMLGELAGIAGCRLADAGEFTRRAFENDKMDLLEVEGLADLLVAETETQRRLALRQFSGQSSSVISQWRESVLKACGLIEAAIDFVDDGDVAAQAVVRARPAIAVLIAELSQALKDSEAASHVRRGLRIVIAGAPNVGKSTLLNCLAGRRAAIVSPIAGTTRDVVEAPVMIAGCAVTLADTAGLRDAETDPVEAEGMRLSHAEIVGADIVVWVESLTEGQTVMPARQPDLVILNKADLVSDESIQIRNDMWLGQGLAVSLEGGDGVSGLKAVLAGLVASRNAVAEHAVVARARHVTAIGESIRFLNDALSRPDDLLELMAEDVRHAARALALVTGRVGVEDVLGKIFADFCVGK